LARLTDNKRDMIISDFNIGKSQNQLAKDYECSPATINKLCKGKTPKYKDKVNTFVAIKSELINESEYQSECFDKEVNELMKNKEMILNLTKLNLTDAKQKIDEGLSSIGENKIAQELIDKASVTLGVNERFSNSQINVNSQTNIQQNNISIEWE
tara:strand:+ start:1230 stop:1694 length:465 start_codon:yes stop_codon:yes gene_type:complete